MMTMFLKKWIRKIKTKKLSIRTKLTLSLLSIATVLLISSCITLLQYRSMSNYVSNLIADNVRNVNLLERLSDDVHVYNAEVMSLLWVEARDSSAAAKSSFTLENLEKDRAYCDSLRMYSRRPAIQERADSLALSFDAFASQSKLLEEVLSNPGINTGAWYHENMQPLYDDFRADVFELNTLVYEDLEANSATFDRGFYRSIIPGAVALAVGLLLILLLLLFMSVYYVKPLYQMLRGLDDYRLQNKKYSVHFEGDDELSRLNDGISEVVGENQQLRKRVSYMRETISELKK